MLNLIKRQVKGVLAAAGYEMRRRPPTYGKPVAQRAGLKVNVGCGDTRMEGYLGCDVRPGPAVDVVCRAWELSQHCIGLEAIYSRHMLEHLTEVEVIATLKDWHCALAGGGRLHVIVPDMDFHCRQWLESAWSESKWADAKSTSRHAFHSIFGWQRETDRGLDRNCWPDEQVYWDVHKSGFGKGLLELFLRAAGFVEIECRTEEQWHLVADARKA
jgi:hypothetical protein